MNAMLKIYTHKGNINILRTLLKLKYHKIIDSFEINVFSDQFPSMK